MPSKPGGRSAIAKRFWSSCNSSPELDRLGRDHPEAACHLVASQRFSPYLLLDGPGRQFIDRANVRRALQLDGKIRADHQRRHAVRWLTSLSATKTWRIIEACFRKLKTTGLGAAAGGPGGGGALDIPLDAAADRGAMSNSAARAE